jgi:hypothetical protein
MLHHLVGEIEELERDLVHFEALMVEGHRSTIGSGSGSGSGKTRTGLASEP